MNTTSPLEAVRRAREHWENRYETVRLVARYLGVSAAGLGREIGLSQAIMSDRFVGRKRFEPEELEGIAVALDIPVEVLHMEPDAAVRWLIDHPKNRLAGTRHTAKRRREHARSGMPWSPTSPQLGKPAA